MTILAVPCEGADVLALFGLDGTALGEIRVGSHPVHATVINGRVFVATMGERSVTVVEPDGEVIRIETGVLGPAHIEAAASLALVPCTAGDVVAVIDTNDSTLVGRVPTGPEPHDLGVIDTLGLVGSRVGGILTVFDPTPCRVVRSIDVPDPETARLQGIEVASFAGGTAAYVVDQGNRTVLRVDSEEILSSADAGEDPYEVAVSRNRVWVPARREDVVYEFSPDLSERTAHPTAAGPQGVAVVDNVPWIFHRSAPVLLNPDREEISLPAPALAATELPEGRLLVSHYETDAISLVDTDAAEVVWTTETPAGPFGPVTI